MEPGEQTFHWVLGLGKERGRSERAGRTPRLRQELWRSPAQSRNGWRASLPCGAAGGRPPRKGCDLSWMTELDSEGGYTEALSSPHAWQLGSESFIKEASERSISMCATERVTTLPEDCPCVSLGSVALDHRGISPVNKVVLGNVCHGK